MPKRYVTVEQFHLDRANPLELELAAGEKGLDRKILHSNAQVAGLYLTGFTKNLKGGRIVVFGQAEMGYLRSLDESDAEERVRAFCQHSNSCIIISEKQRAPKYFKSIANEAEVPVFTTPQFNGQIFDRINRYLNANLSETQTVHGVMLDVLGVGVLLLGESGIGKSETALDLIMRGHRLVADDIVEVHRAPPDALLGQGVELIRHHMEVRGLGIINIRDLFGISSIRERKRIELICSLIEWKENEEVERLGLDDPTYSILDVEIPYLRIPVRPGRNLAVIVEIAARNQLLKYMGHHSAQEFQQKLMERISVNDSLRSAEEQEVE